MTCEYIWEPPTTLVYVKYIYISIYVIIWYCFANHKIQSFHDDAFFYQSSPAWQRAVHSASMAKWAHFKHILREIVVQRYYTIKKMLIPMASHVSSGVDSFRCFNDIWRHRSGTSLDKLMTAPGHYMYQYWFITSKLMWHSARSNFTASVEETVLKTSLKIMFFS